MRNRSFMAVWVLGLLAATFGIGGCGSSSIGLFEVQNLTEKPVRVETFTVGNHGEKKVYATSLLVPGGMFTHGAGQEDRLMGMRARFFMPDEPDGGFANSVTLDVPKEGRRMYDLKIINARLTAQTVTRRPDTSGEWYQKK